MYRHVMYALNASYIIVAIWCFESSTFVMFAKQQLICLHQPLVAYHFIQQLFGAVPESEIRLWQRFDQNNRRGKECMVINCFSENQCTNLILVYHSLSFWCLSPASQYILTIFGPAHPPNRSGQQSTQKPVQPRRIDTVKS